MIAVAATIAHQLQNTSIIYRNRALSPNKILVDLKSKLQIAAKKSVIEFSVGAVSLDDYRPVNEKIQIMRETLRRLNARVLMLKIKRDTKSSDEMPTESIEDTYQRLQEDTARTIINNNAIKQCLLSSAIGDVMSNKTHVDINEKMYDHLKKLFMLNDAILSTQYSIQTALQKQLDLKIQCQKEIFNYHKFLKEQDEQRKQKLQKTNPKIAKNKEKMMKDIRKINIIKKLITNLIATSGKLLEEEPLLLEMLEKHAQLINEETIIRLTETDNKNEA
ncbi:hypothetical protein KPH14_008327 [Odynerus spinipes]|uniref:Uncharacterized protein n=1 Tax=Odynerus spinipes TaxID=1348599 RepID=A0AAD9R950_9HYME|nr:hypothetical protein KPH14_008327 [Odynerus spinipes]